MAAQLDKIPPTCKAMLICDQVIIERDTEKISVIGSYSTLSLERASPHFGPFCIFPQLTAGNAECRVIIEVQDLREGDVISKSEPKLVQLEDRLEVLNLIAAWPAIPIEHAGVYDVVAFADGIEIDRQRLQISFDSEGEHHEEKGFHRKWKKTKFCREERVARCSSKRDRQDSNENRLPAARKAA